MREFSKEDRELAAKAMWMKAFEVTLESAFEAGLDSDSIMVGMVTTMTTVIRELFKQMKEEEN